MSVCMCVEGGVAEYVRDHTVDVRWVRLVTETPHLGSVFE